MSDLSPINAKTRAELDLLEQGQPGITNDLIQLFVADAPRQMERIEADYASRDREGVRQAAHFLRSGALVLGLSSLCERSREVEHLDLSLYGDAASDQMIGHLREDLDPVLGALLEQSSSA